MDRVKFYSTTDLGNGYQLQKAENILESYNDTKEYNITKLIEFYNITKYIDNKIFLKKWDDTYIDNVKKICIQMKKRIYKYFDEFISEKNIKIIIKDLPIQYIEDFLELFEKKIEKINIRGNVFIQAIKEINIPIYHILYFKKIVRQYDNELKEIMLEDAIDSAVIIIRKYYIKEKRNQKIEIPKSLSMKDKEKILIKYIDSEHANLNYIRIIAKIQSNKDSIQIDDKTKLKAQRKVIELENKIFKEGTSIGYSYNVLIDDKQEIEKDEKLIGAQIICSYSKKWIENNKDDYATLLNNFIYLFDFTDIEGRIELVNKKHEYATFEKIMNLNILKAYNPNSTFGHKKMISLMQINAYYEQLNRFNIRLEDIVEWFFEVYLKDNFKIENYSVSMPSKESTFFEKCKTILPEIDHILKQYKYYVEDGKIDPELISISSEHMFFKDIPSKIKNKYVYLKDNDENNLIDYYFFSDQCMLAYLEKVGEKYNNFFSLIVKENIKYNDYPEYDKKDLDWLLQQKLIYVNGDGYIKINNQEKIMIYAELHYKEVINYWKKNPKIRAEIDKMVKDNNLELESSLFSRNEQDYFNFYLNMSEFIDGYDIRNSNLHGTQVGDRKSDVHYTRYLQILLLVILIVIKINDDICLFESNIYKKEKEYGQENENL